MVKHVRRSHQRGVLSNEMEDSLSETGSEHSPATPKSHNALPWQPYPLPLDQPSQPLQRAASFADFGQPMPYALPPQYSQRHSMSSGGVADYHAGGPHPQQTLPHLPHPNQHLLQRAPSLPHHSFFVPEQSNPAVATMHPNPHHAPQMPYQQVPRQAVERPHLEIPYPNVLTAGMQSSPSTFSPGSGRSPSVQEGFYTHAPPPSSAGYTLHSAGPDQLSPLSFPGSQVPHSSQAQAATPRTHSNPMEMQRDDHVMQQSHQHAGQQHLKGQPEVQSPGPFQSQTSAQGRPNQQPQPVQGPNPDVPALPEAEPTHHQQHQQQAQQQQQQQSDVTAPQTPADDQQWFAYQAGATPVSIPPHHQIGGIHSYAPTLMGMYPDPWAEKFELDTGGIPLPSARIAEM